MTIAVQDDLERKKPRRKRRKKGDDLAVSNVPNTYSGHGQTVRVSADGRNGPISMTTGDVTFSNVSLHDA